MWRTDPLEKPLMLGKIQGGGEGDNKGWDGWMASLTQWTWVWVNTGSWWWTGRPGMMQFKGSQSQTRLSNWTELKWTKWFIFLVHVLVRTVLVIGERKLSPGRKHSNTRERGRKEEQWHQPSGATEPEDWMFSADIVILDFQFSCPLFSVHLLLLLL